MLRTRAPLTALFVVGLTACATADGQPVPDGIETWLDTWAEARRCLVVDAEDTTTGVAISMLTGRDCAKPLHQLQISSPENALWSSAIDLVGKLDDPSPSVRALWIADIDSRAHLLGLIAGHLTTAPTITAPLQALHPDAILSRPRLVEEAWPRQHSIVRELSTRRYYVLEVGAKGPSGVVVLKPVWRSADHAYEIRISSDHGASWQTRIGPPLSHVEDHWQDPQSGTIELLIEDVYGSWWVHRVTPGSPTIVRHGFDRSRDDGYVDRPLRCEDHGVLWQVDGDIAARFGDPPLPLGGAARGGQVACRGEMAVVLRRNPETIERCEDRMCRWEWSPPAKLHGSVALLDC